MALAFLLAAGFVLWARRRLPSWLDPVILCYALGLLAGNTGLGLAPEEGQLLLSAAVLLGIPLLLFPADFVAWLRWAPRTAGATALAFLCVSAVATLSGWLFAPRVGGEGWIVGGMLAGTYTGSAPNLLAVSRALGASEAITAQVVAADFVVAGAFCLLLLSPALDFLRRWLPAEAPPERPRANEAPTSDSEDEAGEGAAGSEGAEAPSPPRLTEWLQAGGLGLAVALTAGGVALCFAPERQELVAILGVTALGVAASLASPVRALRGSALLGDYWILVFCLGFGSLADLARLWEGLSAIFLWTLVVLVASVALHLVCCRLFRIDHDTSLITCTAAIFGPALIPALAAKLGRRELVISGVTAALAGLALGSYLGIGVAYALRASLGAP